MHAQVPVGLPSAGRLAGMLGVAYDGMRMPLALLPGLPALLPAVVAALGDSDEVVHVQQGAHGGEVSEQDVDVEV